MQHSVYTSAIQILSLPAEAPHIHQPPRDRRGCRHGGGHEMRAAAAALAAFEIAVGGRRAALTRLEKVRVHRQAHAAT